MKQEKDIYPPLRRWLKKYWPYTGAYEVKLARGKSLPFTALAKHQERALNIIKHGRFSHKLPDDTIGYKPSDIISLCEEGAYVVVFFQKSKKGYLIDIDEWRRERERSERKSITEERCEKIRIGKIIKL